LFQVEGKEAGHDPSVYHGPFSEAERRDREYAFVIANQNDFVSLGK